MNTELTSHLALIRAHCTAVIEKAKLASTGPWRASDKCDKDQWYILHDVKIEDGETDEAVICRMSWPYDDDANDAAFIANSRQFTPAAAEAVLDAMKALQYCSELFRAHEVIDAGEAGLQSLADKFDYLWK